MLSVPGEVVDPLYWNPQLPSDRTGRQTVTVRLAVPPLADRHPQQLTVRGLAAERQLVRGSHAEELDQPDVVAGVAAALVLHQPQRRQAAGDPLGGIDRTL